MYSGFPGSSNGFIELNGSYWSFQDDNEVLQIPALVLQNLEEVTGVFKIIMRISRFQQRFNRI